MLLSVEELSVFKDFAIFFMGLGLPALLILLSGIAGLHYWKKYKKNEASKTTKEVESPAQSIPLPPLTASDRYLAIRKIRKQLSGFRAKNVALRHDYLYYQKKLTINNNGLPDKKSRYMENFEEKIAAYEKQVAEMQSKIDMLETIPPPLNNEAHYLRELLAEKEKDILALRKSAGDNHLPQAEITNVTNNENLLNEQRQEINRLKSLVEEQEHINDLLYESRQQVNFLQNQLEQRIKSAKILEQRVTLVSDELSQAQFEFHEAAKKIIKIEETIETKDNEIGQMRLQIDAKENELQHLQNEIHSKNDQLLAIEKSFNEMMQENELHKTAIANDREIISSFNNQLAALNEENEHLLNQLRHNKELLYKFYKELKSSVQEDEKESNEQLVEA